MRCWSQVADGFREGGSGMQAETREHEPYKYHPVIRQITDANVHKHGAWAVVIHAMVLNARRMVDRWEQAAFAAAEAAGAGSLSESKDPEAVRTYRTLTRYRRDVKRLEMMLALEVAGRDMAHLNREIVSCFDKNGGEHMQETIIRRLFKAGRYLDLDYDWKQYVQRRMERMRERGKLDYGWGFGRQQTKWYVVTPEVIAQRKASKRAQAKQAAEQKVCEARQAAVLAYLKAQGYGSAEAPRYSSTEVTLSVDDLERLLGLGKGN